MDAKEVKSLREFQLPEDLIAELRHDEEETDKHRWRVGKITADLVDEFGETHGKGNVRKRVAIEIGSTTSTVRDRESMARFYSEEIIEEFEILSWSQLRACKPAGGKGWRALAEWAVESADEFGGRPAPADAITAKRLGPKEVDENGEEVQWKGWELDLISLWNKTEKLLEDVDCPPELKDAASRFRREVKGLYESLDKEAE